MYKNLYIPVGRIYSVGRRRAYHSLRTYFSMTVLSERLCLHPYHRNDGWNAFINRPRCLHPTTEMMVGTPLLKDCLL